MSNQRNSAPAKSSASRERNTAPNGPPRTRLNPNLIWGCALMAAGGSGWFVVVGTNSSGLLIVAGAAMCVWAILQGPFVPVVAETTARRTPAAGKSTETKRSGKRAKSASGRDGARETVESVVVAFILAFLFRTFEAEAFVIPTGSMAPTLYGRHKDVDCEQCGFHFSIGASDEIQPENRAVGRRPGGSGLLWFLNQSGLINRVSSAFCPNCRHENDVYALPVHKGDRILVNKHDAEPKRFDVIVFKYPEEPQINYIKRLVGLPGETILIRKGNLWSRKAETEEWKILRKDDPGKQRVLQLPVYDDTHPPNALLDAGWPERWAPVETGDGPNAVAGWGESDSGWTADREARTFRLEDSGGELRWLRYRHFVPLSADWSDFRDDSPNTRFDPRPRLIADFCHYNAYTTRYSGYAPETGVYWVGDLTVNASVRVDNVAADGEIMLELVEGMRWNRCHIDLNTGEARLTYVDRLIDRDEVIEHDVATAGTRMKGPGSYDISFANVDNRLCLWINDQLVDFGAAAEYTGDSPEPGILDLTPVGIAARGVTAVVSGLVLERDLYYRANVAHPEFPDSYQDIGEIHGDESSLAGLLDNPEEWAQYYDTKFRERTERFRQYGNIDALTLGPDEFLVLGDNSPRSKDSRLFGISKRTRRLVNPGTRHAVPRSALIGKAFFIYWPHGVPFLNGGDGFPVAYHIDESGRTIEDYPSFRVPFYPQVQRMERIR